MLLRFGVSNHLSIRDFQALLLTPAALREPAEGLIACPAAPGGKLLPAAVIYGANASGKTNFIHAMHFMRHLVLGSHAHGKPGENVPRYPFKLDPACIDTRSRFEIDFVLDDGVRYHYGFEASDKAFESEWLYAFPKARRRTLFERDGSDYRFGRWLSGKNEIVRDLTRPNSLYVSAAAQNGHEQLSGIFGYFEALHGVGATDVTGVEGILRFAGDEPDPRTIDFLEHVGIAVSGYRKKKDDMYARIGNDMKRIRAATGMPEGAAVSEALHGRFAILARDGELQLAHRSWAGNDVYLELERESAGTRRLLLVLRETYRALDKGLPLAIDELDASLHTQAAKSVLGLFCSHETNPNGAQLIATTHDTNLMKVRLSTRDRILRQDQIWFAEQGRDGETTLYPLTDYRTRKGDNIEREYLQGRYGATPLDDIVAGHGAA